MFHMKTSFYSFSISDLFFLFLSRLQNERKLVLAFFFLLLVLLFVTQFDDTHSHRRRRREMKRVRRAIISTPLSHSYTSHMELLTSIFLLFVYSFHCKNNSHKKHEKRLKINWTSTFVSDPESIKTNLLAGSNGFSFQTAINCCMFCSSWLRERHQSSRGGI